MQQFSIIGFQVKVTVEHGAFEPPKKMYIWVRIPAAFLSGCENQVARFYSWATLKNTIYTPEV